MYLCGAAECCSTVWKTGQWRLDPALQRRCPPQFITTFGKKGWRNGKTKPDPVRMVYCGVSERKEARANSTPLPPSSWEKSVFGWMNWSSSSRRSTAIQAGRSKAKKGKTSGGRIEQRPPFRRQTGGSREGMNSQSAGQKQLPPDGPRTEEEEMNMTWQEAGLGDRRSGGKFKPDRGATPPKNEATRVGGWGRDKSMQRVLTPEQQRAESSKGKGAQRKDRTSASSTGSSEISPTKKRQSKKPYEGFDSDPRGDHPPEYYKYGPYGPYAWKGITVGKLVEGEWDTENVVFFSHVEDEAEREDIERANVVVEYTEAVANFDESVGIQYFYAFARRRVGPRGDPWQDWTLVAQIAVESGAVFDNQGELFEQVGSRTQDLTTQCVAWARPDLVYVRKPKFQLRLEPQEQFLLEMMKLVDSAEEFDNSASYYATLCNLVNVNIGASASSVRRGYEALDEMGRMECLKHIFTKHPVKILASARFDRQFRREQEGQTGGNGLVSASGEDEENMIDEKASNGSHAQEKDKGFNHDSRQTLESRWAYAESRNVRESGGAPKINQQDARSGISNVQNAETGKSDNSSINKNSGSVLPWSESRALLHVWGPPRSVPPRKVVYAKRHFRSAVRPFSYSNLVEEIAQMRTLVSENEIMVYSGS